jgi:hypothetical protein
MAELASSVRASGGLAVERIFFDGANFSPRSSLSSGFQEMIDA